MVTSRWILDSSVPLIYKSSSHITEESLGHPMSLIYWVEREFYPRDITSPYWVDSNNIHS